MSKTEEYGGLSVVIVCFPPSHVLREAAVVIFQLSARKHHAVFIP